MTTKAIILCAGTGKRMRDAFPGIPKCLVPLGNGITPLEWSLAGLVKFPQISEIVIVTGYQAENVEAFVQNNFPQFPITFRNNEQYLHTDAAYSFCLAAENDPESTSLLMYGDALYHPSVGFDVINTAEKNVVVVDREKSYDSMDMKVSVDTSFKLAKINKQLTQAETYAESTCLYKIGPELKKELVLHYVPGLKWFEDLLEQVIQRRQRSVGILAVKSSAWAEIDRPEDISDANKFMRRQRFPLGINT